MKYGATPADRKFWAASLIIAQTLAIVSTFLWKDNGRHTVTCSVFVFFSLLFWTVGMPGLFSFFKDKMPVYYRLGLIYAFYGIFGGVAFAFEGLYSEIFQVSDKIGVKAAELFPIQMNLVLFWSGPAFPLTFIILGIVLAVKKKFWWTGALLSLGGITFPVSRIFRIQWVAHLNDLVFLIPLCIIAYQLWIEADDQIS